MANENRELNVIAITPTCYRVQCSDHNREATIRKVNGKWYLKYASGGRAIRFNSYAEAIERIKTKWLIK